MPIQSGDVKLLKSAVMADVPEGGGAPTGNVIADGVSNAIFPDISELDRAGGRVNLRKTFVSVQTDDRDTYFGGNVIVAEPPEDPRVSVTLFSTESTFDTRSQAQTRVESYLNQGPEWPGYLYENHIAGQRVVQFFQRPTAELPNVGRTLVLVQNEGQPSERLQYIRATSVSSVIRLFYDEQTQRDYEAAIVTIEISDALRTDFTGSPASRTFSRATNATKVRDTVVADAGTYVGVVPLTTAANLGDFTVRGESIFTQLVPSAQTETPISDVRMNGLSAALVPTGDPINVTLSLGFTIAQSMHVGGPIMPGSLSVVREGITVTDSAGVLVSSGSQVGLVDYENGILSLTTNVYGVLPGPFSVTFIPAAVPELIAQQIGLPVTQENRSLSYVVTLDNPPLKRTLSVSYLAQGKWYVLTDDGNGVVKGSDSAFGSGTINYTTGSLVVTLGALPDVGGVILIKSDTDVTAVRASNTDLTNGGKAYFAINTSGAQSEEAGAKNIAIGSLTIAWNNGGTKTATDDGLGNITGDATGTVDYTRGVIRLSPNALPPVGTTFLVDIDGAVGNSTGTTALQNGNIGTTDIVPGTIAIPVTVEFNFTAANFRQVNFASRTAQVNIYDRAGNLYFRDPGNGAEVVCGTINYATGDFNVNPTPSVLKQDIAGPIKTTISVAWIGGPPTTVQSPWNTNLTSAENRAAVITTLSASVTYSGTLPGADSISVAANELRARVLTVPNYSLRGVSFAIGENRYLQLTDNTLVRNPSPTNGGGTPSGIVVAAGGYAVMNNWQAGAAPTIVNWRGIIAPPTVGVAAPFTAFQTIFRTAASPLRPGSLSILGTMQDGTTFNVTAGLDGKINGTRVKGRVNYEYGYIELYFVNPAGDSALNIDLSDLGISGLTSIPADLVQLNSLRYNAVSFSYLPLDADILGIDPVRLPSDGRVPIFRPGGFAVVGHTGSVGPATVSNGQTINCGRVRLSRVRVIGDDGVVINTGYTADLEAGTVTFTDVSGYSQPVTVEHRIEDMGVVREVQISGEISFTRPLTHNYPLGSYVSSALITGDLFSRVPLLFDQASWNNTWSDTLTGSAATATFNSTQYPIEVTNRGALTERWVVRFTNSTTFEVIGENVGVIANGTTGADCAPVNPATGAPYFRIPYQGWGSGWATGNVLRFNTIGSQFPVWVVRTIQQGPETVPDDTFTLLIRGDVDQA